MSKPFKTKGPLGSYGIDRGAGRGVPPPAIALLAELAGPDLGSVLSHRLAVEVGELVKEEEKEVEVVVEVVVV